MATSPLAEADNQRQLMCNDGRTGEIAHRHKSRVLGAYSTGLGSVTVLAGMTRVASRLGKTLPAVLTAPGAVWSTTQLRDIPPEILPSGAQNPLGMETVYIGAVPVGDRDWIRSGLFALVACLAMEEAQVSINADLEYTDAIMADSNNVTRAFVFRNLRAYGATPGYDHDTLVRRIREANRAFGYGPGGIYIRIN